MKGWKTLTGGLGFIFVGVYNFVNGDTSTGLQNILTGLAILGLGHKLDKNQNG